MSVILDAWPFDALQLTTRPWWRTTYVTKSGGTTLNGDPVDVVSDGGGRWLCDASVYLPDAAAVKLLRALIEGTMGGSIPQIIPYYARAEAPYPGGIIPADVPFSDGSTFSDGALFRSGSITVTAAAASLGATSLTITKTAVGDDIDIVGARFGIDHPTVGKRLYSVTRIDDDVIRLSGPLHEAITDDTVLDFDYPACVMQLTNSEAAMSVLQSPYMGTATLQFRECPVG